MSFAADVAWIRYPMFELVKNIFYLGLLTEKLTIQNTARKGVNHLNLSKRDAILIYLWE